MKKLSVFGKSVPILAILMISILVVGAGAALLEYYGGVTSTVGIDQAILLDGLTQPDSGLIADLIAGVGGDTVVGAEHNLTSQSENRIVVDLVTSEYDVAISAVFPMYKLDSIEGDDAVSVVLDAPIAWGAFVSVPFSYLIEEDLWETLAIDWPELTGPWIPQINIKLLDSEGELAYYASWHSFRHGILGEVGERTRITALKGDFYLFDVDWGLIGLYSEYQGDKGPIDACSFERFSQQAGDTSVDPNDPATTGGIDPNPWDPVLGTGNPYWPAKSAQIVWVGNYGMDVEGIIINPDGYSGTSYDAVRDTVEFRMVYELHPAGEGTYPVTTNVKPIGLA